MSQTDEPYNIALNLSDRGKREGEREELSYDPRGTYCWSKGKKGHRRQPEKIAREGRGPTELGRFVGGSRQFSVASVPKELQREPNKEGSCSGIGNPSMGRGKTVDEVVRCK